MYPIIEAFLEEKGYKTLVKHRFYKTEIRADIGQGYIELDVVGYKDDIAWIIECKVPCTIEQFGFAVGQLICYKFIFDTKPELLSEKIGKKVKTRYSIALLTTETYQLTNTLLETFKTILHSNNLKFGLLIVNDKSKEAKDAFLGVKD